MLMGVFFKLADVKTVQFSVIWLEYYICLLFLVIYLLMAGILVQYWHLSENIMN